MPVTVERAQHFPPGSMGLKVIRMIDHPVSQNMHAHEFEELVVITGGKGTHLVNGQRHGIARGDVFVILGSTAHCYPAANHLNLINVLFDPPSLRLPMLDLSASPGYVALFQVEPRVRRQRAFPNRLRLAGRDLRELLGLIGELEGELRSSSPGHQFAAVSLWMRILVFLSRLYVEETTDQAQTVGSLSRVISFMSRHYIEPLTIDDLAHVAGMSTSTLFREFKSIMGRPPIDHLLHLRIERAGRLLQSSPMRIGEVAAAAGFEDSNYFTRQFRRIKGMSPREYRARSAPGPIRPAIQG